MTIKETSVERLKLQVKGNASGSASLTGAWTLPDDEGGYRLSWGNSWRLELVSSGRDAVFPKLGEFRFTEDLSRPLIIIGEEGSGESSFLAWLETKASRKTVRQINFANQPHKSMDSLARYIVDKSPVQVETPPKEMVYDKRNDPTAPDESAQSGVVPHLARLAQKSVVAFVRLDHLDPGLGGQLLGQLRYAFESTNETDSLKRLTLVMMGQDEQAFDIEPYSAIISVSDLCRLPRFDAVEIALLLDRHWNADHENPDHEKFVGEARAVLRITGGQPLLTQLLLGKLEKTAGFGLSGQQRVYRELRDHPPDVLPAWRQRLAGMMLRDERLAALTRDLARGQQYAIDTGNSNARAPDYARHLSLSGWLSPGLDEHGNRVWRFSDLHRYWAADVVRDPARYARIQGGQ